MDKEIVLANSEGFLKDLVMFAQGISSEFGTGFVRLDLFIGTVVAITALQVARYYVIGRRDRRAALLAEREAKLDAAVVALSEKVLKMTSQHKTINEFLRTELEKIRGTLKGLRESIEIGARSTNRENLYQFQKEEESMYQGELD